MQQYLVFILLLNSTLAFCQAYPDSIYNDDPLQKIPVGVEEASHRIIEAKGGTVDQVRIHPPSWWVGMAHPRLELLISDQNIRDFDLTIDYPGIDVRTVKRLENPNYLFVDLELSETIQAGQFEIQLKKGKEERSYSYELKEKAVDKQRIQGLTSADLMYLIMPDRFANGDRSNDSFSDLEQVGINRDKVFFRHGGDLIGVMEHLDYVQQLGVTAIWLNPVLENDQAYESYHGYAITDHYRVDPRFGKNEQYRYLADICQARGIKLIKDIIHNHVGDQHWFIKDLPSKDWIHQFDAFTKTSYRAPTLMDPYAAETDKEIMLDGWFDHHMPDLNQKQPQLANYLIQNHIWWIEYAGIDGYR
ncbi:MAG: alpha-amylase family glycosyl hydrolase, partial [Bacteroidota bacterium]